MLFRANRMILGVLIFLLIGSLQLSCKKLEVTRVKFVTVDIPVYDFPSQSFEVGGEIIDTGENEIDSYGHVWSLTPNPEVLIDDYSEFSYDKNIQSFVSTISRLVGTQRYYLRSYIKDIHGKYHYSEEITFETPFDLFLDFVFVEGGEFMMGAQPDDNLAANDEKPQLRTIVNDFYMGTFEVTQAFWAELMPFIRGSNVGCISCPITGVSWEDVQDFINKLNTRTGDTYRLPTEAEWEYAASGGNQRQGFLYSGSNTVVDVGWYKDISGSPTVSSQIVGQKKPNELGLYDMSGNVGEICSDWYEYDYYKDTSRALLNPLGPSDGIEKSTRGGAYNDESQFLRVF